MVVLSEEKKLKISGLFLVSLSFFPVLRPALQSILIISFCVVSIVFYHKNFLKRVSNKKVVFAFLLFTGYYLWHLVSSFWSEETVDALADAQSNIILLLFPLVFLFFHPQLDKDTTKRVQLIFVLAMLGYLFLWYRSYLIGVSHYQILKLDELPIKEYSFFEQIAYFITEGFYWISGSSIRGYRMAEEEIKLFVHHNYIASYFVLAFYASLNLIFGAKNIKIKIILAIPAVLFLGIIFYLPSKMNQLVLLMALPVFTYYLLGKRMALSLILLGLIASSFLFYNNRDKITSIKFIEKENLISKEVAIIDFYRYHVYNCILKKTPKSFLFGMGKGDVQPYLNSCLPDEEWPGLSEEEREYNTHSQLLSYLVSGGIIGLFLCIALWIKLFSLALNRNRVMLIILLMTIFANIVFENYLARVWGSFIFVFFTFIYLQNDLIQLTFKEEKENLKPTNY